MSKFTLPKYVYSNEHLLGILLELETIDPPKWFDGKNELMTDELQRSLLLTTDETICQSSHNHYQHYNNPQQSSSNKQSVKTKTNPPSRFTSKKSLSIDNNKILQTTETSDDQSMGDTIRTTCEINQNNESRMKTRDTNDYNLSSFDETLAYTNISSTVVDEGSPYQDDSTIGVDSPHFNDEDNSKEMKCIRNAHATKDEMLIDRDSSSFEFEKSSLYHNKHNKLADDGLLSKTKSNNIDELDCIDNDITESGNLIRKKKQTNNSRTSSLKYELLNTKTSKKNRPKSYHDIIKSSTNNSNMSNCSAQTRNITTKKKPTSSSNSNSSSISQRQVVKPVVFKNGKQTTTGQSMNAKSLNIDTFQASEIESNKSSNKPVLSIVEIMKEQMQEMKVSEKQQQEQFNIEQLLKEKEKNFLQSMKPEIIPIEQLELEEKAKLLNQTNNNSNNNFNFNTEKKNSSTNSDKFWDRAMKFY